MNRLQPAQERRHSRRGWLVGLLLLCLVGGGVANYLRPLPQLAAQPMSLPAVDTGQPDIAWPAYGQAAVGAPGWDVLAQHGSDTPTPIASIAKVITALAVLEKKPLTAGQTGPSLTIGDSDVALYHDYAARDGSLLPVVAGEQLNEYQILQALMLPSANNIADSAAIWAFGSLAAYQTFANQFLAEHGLTNTTVADDASGFSPASRSTARDLVKLGELALAQPVLADIVSQPRATLPIAGQVSNVNSLLGTEGIVGIKTGNTDEAGGCLLYAAHYTVASGQNITVVIALMGAPDLNKVLADAVPLLRSARQNFVAVTAVHKGQKLGSYHVPWGPPVAAVADQDLTSVVWRGTPVGTKLQFNKLTGQQASNARIGTLNTQVNGTTNTSAVVLQSAIPQPSWHWRLLRNPF